MSMKETLTSFAKVTKEFVVKNAPTILTVTGIAGSITSTGLAIKITPNVQKKFAEKQSQKKDPLTKLDKIGIAVPMYWPVILSEAASIACVVGANQVNLKRQAALIAAYTLSENNLREYKNKVLEIAGPKKTETIEREVREERAAKRYDPDGIILTGNGDTIFYEEPCGRYFKSSINAVTSAVIKINNMMMSGDVPLNDLYDELDIPLTTLGDLFCFPGENDAEFISTDFTASTTPSGEPCLMLWLNLDDAHRSPSYDR